MAWERRQWAMLAAVLAVVIVVLLMMWPRQAAGPDSIVIRVVDGPTVLSTQIVPLR
jgi:hypothetical protein